MDAGVEILLLAGRIMKSFQEDTFLISTEGWGKLLKGPEF